MLYFELEEYKVLYKVSRLTADIDEETFDKLAATIATETGLHGCSIWKKKKSAKGITRLGYYEVSPDGALPHLDYRVAEQVINLGLPWSKNWFEDAELSAGSVSFNGMALPLEHNGVVIGALCLWMSKDQPADMSQHLAKELAVQIARGVKVVLDLRGEQKEPQPKPGEDVYGLNRLSAMPGLPGISVAARSLSSKPERSDFYDFFPFGETGFAFILGDSMGQGTATSIVQFTTRMVFHAVADKKASPGKVLARINDVLYPEFENMGMFMGLICGTYDCEGRVFRFANAGYTEPVIFTGGKRGRPKFKSVGPFIGLNDQVGYQNTTVSLASGDIIVLYSDGLAEAMNGQGELYSRDRIEAVLEKNRLYDATGLLDCLFLDISKFMGRRRQADDITLTVIKVS